MALVLADRVRETTTVTGTGTATLLGAVSGYQSFSAVGNANTTYYVIANQSASEWEVGIGTYTSSGTTLSRTTVLSSSNSGSLVNFSAGTKDVFVDYPASKAVYEDASGNIDSYPITGGTINGTTIGATTASTGRFSDLTDTGLTSGRVIYASTGGNLVDASNFTYDGTNLVAGAIQNTPLGATTPAAGTFTTLTARGTGQNLVLYSEQFDNAAWTKSNSAVTANSTTAPDGTTTADTLTLTGGGTLSRTYQSVSFVTGVQYTQSCYVKTGTQSFVQMTYGASAFGSSQYANFDISSGALGTVTGGTAAITSVGSGWYRISFSAVAAFTVSDFAVQIIGVDSTTSARISTLTASNKTVFIWGAQLEISSSAGTYIPTTTTAVYGTPTLSFSGVSTIGLESNGSLFVQPAGTGALQAQATTSSATGGNARGANAVDWQTSRGAASNVASGTQSVIGGGTGNTASGGQSVVVGGFTSTASVTSAAIVGGSTNTASGTYSFVGSGYGHTLSGNYGAIVGGYTNTSAGYYGFIGGGFTNSGTTNSAVTTQSGTMNGTTAVTLSGSNANIKVGQLITGTSISFPDTYVAAISGTSLTLSKAATGSSTSTLSFYTPHGVVVGGGNNQATGSYSFIGGGGDAGTAGNRNVASGDWSVVGGGRKNTASGSGSIVVGGGWDGSNIFANTASGNGALVVGGIGNTSSNVLSSVLGGQFNVASGSYSTVVASNSCTANGYASTVIGGEIGISRSIAGNIVLCASSQPISGQPAGAFQSAVLVLARQTTDATPTVLASNSSSATTTNQVILPNNSAYFFTGEVVAGVTGGGNTKGWTIEGVIKRGANAASTALVGTPTVTSTYADAGASTWVIAVTADTTNGGLAVTFTGQASTTIRTVAKISTVEMTF